EREEERIALRVHLDAAVAPARVAHDLAMPGEHIRVVLGAELVQQAGRPLDVGEEEGDGAGGPGAHEPIMTEDTLECRAASGRRPSILLIIWFGRAGRPPCAVGSPPRTRFDGGVTVSDTVEDARSIATDGSAARAGGVVLLTLCAGQFLMALDSSVMNVSIAT